MKQNIDLKKWIPASFPKRRQLLIILLVGVLLVVIAIPTEKKKEEPDRYEAPQEINDTVYEKRMEKKLEQTLTQVAGVGDVKVMLTLKGTSEKVVEKDRERDEERTREETVYHGETASSRTPFVNKELRPEVEGVVVIAEGGDNALVIQNIMEAVQALFPVDTHKIKVMKMN